MQVKTTHPTKTEAVVEIVATTDEINNIKDMTLKTFQGKVKVPGFRADKVPNNMLEKHVDPAALQSAFLEEAIEYLYPRVIVDQSLRPIERPKLTITKFVPYTTLEFTAKVQVVGNIKIADYKAIKLKRDVIKLKDADINDVIESVRKQLAEKSDVDRAAKKGDEVYIDFSGADTKGQKINGTEGTNYPLTLGSDQFIPGFEDNLVGLKAGDNKSFDVVFPKDYQVKALASKKVTFSVEVIKVQQVTLPKVDDSLAAKAGSFKTLDELKDDIRKQVGMEKQNESDRQYESDLIKMITDKSKVDIPSVMIDEEIERLIQKEKQNALYRGQTWNEYLESNESDEARFREEVKPGAESRVKASLVLAEIAELENLDVTKEELDLRIQIMKGQYKDAETQAQLDKPDVIQDIASRMLTEKVIEILVKYAA